VLTRDVQWHFNMKLKFNHLERCCVPVTHQIPYKSSITSRSRRSVPVRDPSGLYDGVIKIFPWHVVNKSDKPMVEYLDFHYILLVFNFFNQVIQRTVISFEILHESFIIFQTLTLYFIFINKCEVGL